MSYPGVDPSDTIVAEPVGTQAVSEGEQKPNPLLSETVAKETAIKAVTDMFAVSDNWTPKQLLKFVIEFDTGQKCLVKHLTTMDLVNADLIEDIDFFTKKLFATQDVLNAETVEETESVFSKTFWGTLRDVERRKKFLEMTGKLMATAAIKPKIVYDGVAIVEDENGDKTVVFGNDYSDNLAKQIELFGRMIPALKDGETYASAIDIGDRLTFFRELNAPLETIQPFRDEPDVVLGSIQPSQESELPPV